MIIKIFDTDIVLKEYYCELDDNPKIKIDEPYINLYINVTNYCNANCSFCCHTNREKFQFNFEKYIESIDEISKKCKINKVSFTGGEPTFKPNVIEFASAYLKGRAPSSTININTNGAKLENLLNSMNYIDTIALSRHHFDDEINASIFQTKVISKNDINNFPYKDKLNLSCNLMKGYIDNIDKVKTYLEFASEIDAGMVGFVTLMKVNPHATKLFIDFNDLKIEEDKDIFIAKNWQYETYCKCRNYVYVSNNGKIVEAFARHYADPNFSNGALVFDGLNLRKGFNGEIIH